MRAYFEVGEEVLLRSVRLPHLDGEYTITRCVFKKKARTVGFGEILENVYGYTLDGIDSGSVDNTWLESSLRKKHNPGQDFNSLIADLNKDKVNEH